MTVAARGSWPDAVTLRRGWALANARPWNDSIPHAVLRLVRGGSGFLVACADWLAEAGAPVATSPPIPGRATSLWAAAGFGPYLELELFSRPLAGVLPSPNHPVLPGCTEDWRAAITIDGGAFPELWRLGELGLRDAHASTPDSAFLVVGGDFGVEGFAIVGVGTGTGYLQRLAVRPDARRRGVGRSLVRASLQWARGRGARSMLLNTQPGNDEAACLYRSEGFILVGDRLQILRRQADNVT